MKRIFMFTTLFLVFILISFVMPASAATAWLAGDADGYLTIPNRDVTVSASSELKDKFGKYPAVYANDTNTRTTWAERASGNGEGEWLEFTFPEQEVIGFTIRAGYHKSKDVYRKNARPREILVTVGDEPAMEVELDDVREPQTVLFDQPVLTDSLTVTLSTFYNGTKYKDACITDLSVLTAGAEETVEDDSWQGRYRTFIRRHFPQYTTSSGAWAFMKLIDLDFDDVPELLACVDDSHVPIYHIVSSIDIDNWAELQYSDDFQKGDIFNLYRNPSTGEKIWLLYEQYSIQGTQSLTENFLTYSPGNAETEMVFNQHRVIDPSYEEYGEKAFSYKRAEVTEAEYQKLHRSFYDGIESQDFKMARCDEESNSVAEALANFDAMCEDYD